jgi:HAE1 family hydrophobic/amphiphilic exporter-1
VFFWGIYDFTYFPFPSISPPMVNVTADYPGSNGELMIKSVIIPLERALNGVPGMKYMTSDAGNDGGEYQLYLTGTDPNQAAINVQNRVASVLINSSISGKRGVKITREVPSMLMYVNLF